MPNPILGKPLAATIDTVIGEDTSGVARQTFANLATQLAGSGAVADAIAAAAGPMGPFDAQGVWDASGGAFPGGGTASAGDLYEVSVGGTVDSVVFAVGDQIVALVDNASTSTFAANWFRRPAVAPPATTDDLTEGSSNLYATTESVTAAGALMDSELTSEAAVKAINQGLATTDAPTFAGLTVGGVDLSGVEAGATADQTGAEIRTLLNGEADTNILTDARLTVLEGVADVEAGVVHAADRPGDNGYRFTATTTGSGVDAAPITSAVLTDIGLAAQLTGAGDVLTRDAVAISQDVLEVTARVRREIDPLDPTGHATQLIAIWLDEEKALVSETVLATIAALTNADGLTEMSVRVSALGSVTGVTAPPSGAVYARFGVRKFGADGLLSVETLRVTEVTDLHSVQSADLSALIASTEAARDAAAAAAGAVDLVTLDGYAAVAAADLSSAGTVSLRYGLTEHDGLGGLYQKDASDTISTHSPPEVLVSDDGSRFRPAITVYTSPASLRDSNLAGLPEGTVVRGGAHRYTATAVGEDSPHITTDGGQKLFVATDAPGTVSVDAFGAVGDGSTDDSAAIQAAVDAFSGVTLGPKTYAIASTITVPRGRKIIGTSERETKILVTADVSAFESDEDVIGNLVRDTEISRMFIEKQTPTATTGVYGVLLKGTTNNAWGCKLSHLLVKGFYDGVVIDRPIQCSMEHIDSFEHENDGVVIKGPGTSLHAKAVWGRSNGRYGINLNGSMAYCSFDVCAADENDSHGYAFTSITSGTIFSTGVAFNGCGAEKNGGIGFWGEDSQNIAFNGCVSYQNTSHGFEFQGMRGVVLNSSKTLENGGWGVKTGNSAAGILPSTITLVGASLTNDTSGRISDETKVSDILSPDTNEVYVSRFFNSRLGLKVDDTTVFDNSRVLQNLGRGSHTVQFQKYVVDYTDLSAASTNANSLQSTTIPAGSVMLDCRLRLDTEFSGGAISAATIEVGDGASPYDNFIAPLDVFTGAGTGHKISDVTDLGTRFYNATDKTALRPIVGSDRQVGVRIECTGANTDQLTAGQVTVWVAYMTLP